MKQLFRRYLLLPFSFTGILLFGGGAGCAENPQQGKLQTAEQQTTGLSGPVFERPTSVVLQIGGAVKLLPVNLGNNALQDVLIVHRAHGLSLLGLVDEDKKQFKQKQRIETGRSVGLVALGDFNEDGQLDIVTGSKGQRWRGSTTGNLCGSEVNANNRLPLFLSNSGGGFTLKKPCLLMEQSFAWDDRSITGLVVADFNGDAHQDIALGRSGNYGANYLMLLLGTGDGNFEQALKLEQIRPEALFANDFNGDGHTDLMLVQNGKTHWLKGDGKGGLVDTGAIYKAPIAAIGDINSDGILDLVAIPAVNGDIEILSGDGKGGFSKSNTISTGIQNIYDPMIVDLDRDGEQDLLFRKSLPGAVYFLPGDGKGGFSAKLFRRWQTGTRLNAFTLADLNGDGSADLFTLGITPKGRNITGLRSVAGPKGEAVAVILLQKQR